MARTKNTAIKGRAQTTTKTAHKGPFVRPARTSPALPAPVSPAVPATAVSKKDKKSKESSKSKKTKKAVKSAISSQHGLKKVHRFKPGTVALRNIKKQQNSVKVIIPRAPFIRMVRETLVEEQGMSTYKLRADALLAMREGVEALTIRLLENANIGAIHGKRVTVMPKDLAMVRRIKAN